MSVTPDDTTPPAGFTPDDQDPPAGTTPADTEVAADTLPTVEGGDEVQQPLDTQSPADEPDEVADQSPVPDDSGLDEEDDDQGDGQPG